MALPFKNGLELANALGYGELYQAAEKKEQQDNMNAEAMTESFKKMNGIFKRNIQDLVD